MRRLLDFFSPVPIPAWFMRLGGRLNVAWLRVTRGRGPLGSDVAILTTRGRRSGEPRSTTLLYFERSDHWYVVASFAGLDRHPAWYLNLLADPRVTVEIRGVRSPCVARRLEAAEAAEVWPFLDEAYPGFRHYRRRTGRELPVVELRPVSTGPGA